ncbi:hypothetical protein EJB05_43695 [Eragrostis curvula]|uniref:Uncharacterized protein n=1 Tax=Eragrostis curvula TaxID=38414 RepID=A0A5J9TFX7_9POAL|nr:hypothetical protein EJB05_43694 [Eragrostis curvula]TVU10184.1 hypothetical protein EJB05_43695 [Eragrostis curvula]
MELKSAWHQREGRGKEWGGNELKGIRVSIMCAGHYNSFVNPHKYYVLPFLATFVLIIHATYYATLLQAPECHPPHGRGRAPQSPPSSFTSRGGRRRDNDTATRRATRDASSDSSTIATRYGPSVMPDTSTLLERILVQSQRHCESHGWTTRCGCNLKGCRRRCRTW